MSEVSIIPAISAADFAIARSLIEEYAAELAIDLCFQNFTDELANLRTIYGPPAGVLLLARDGSEWLGCVGMRALRDRLCEMKRLYVKPPHRRRGLGGLLARKAIDHARSCGYDRMVLDTLESMVAARALYESLGFRDTSGYYDNPLDGVRYLALEIAAN